MGAAEPDPTVDSPAVPGVTRSRDVDNEGVRVHYVEHVPDGPSDGPAGDRPAQVFVPGFTCAAEDYVDVLPLFGRRVVVIDLRGRGRSDAPDDGYAYEHHVSDVAAVVADAGIGDFHLCTFSRGTTYGLGYALQHPERVRSVVIGDYQAREIPFPESFTEPFLRGRWRGEPVSVRLAPVAAHGTIRASRERSLWDELGALGRPVLVIRAGKGRANEAGLVNEEIQARYRAAVPGIEIVTFEDSNHDLFRPDPERYPRTVAAFTARHDG